MVVISHLFVREIASNKDVQTSIMSGKIVADASLYKKFNILQKDFESGKLIRQYLEFLEKL